MGEPNQSTSVESARALLARVRGIRPDDDALVETSEELAGLLLAASEDCRTRTEMQRAEQLGRLMNDEIGQAFTTLLTDRVYRSRAPARVVAAARRLLDELGPPQYLPPLARWQLRALQWLGPIAPGLASSGLLARIRRESGHVVLAAEEPALSRHLQRRAGEQTRVNLNLLGEAVLGETEARARIDRYEDLLARPDVESISIKISSIYSQIDVLAWDETLAELKLRLRRLYSQALAHRHRRADGSEGPKLINLDMEAYRDLHLTLDAFRSVMDEDAMLPLTAGVVLQAYLPESAPLQRALTDWARARMARGGAPIRLRLVKGANLLTERAESSLRGWEVPVLPSKHEVDASFKKMLEYGCEPEHAAAVQLGIASHNLFDQALGLVLRASRGVESNVGFEMLEGMADPMRRAIAAVAGSTLVYAPIVARDAMQTAIAYLMRRLDENTAEENFLRHSLSLHLGDDEWLAQRKRFERALRARARVRETPLRDQDRGREEPVLPRSFENTPDTDFASSANRAWIAGCLKRRQAPGDVVLTSSIAGEQRARGPLADGFDPSRPGSVPYRIAWADASDVDRALTCAEAAATEQARTSLADRARGLRSIASELRARRGDLIAAMVQDGAKRVDQADAEVSEAIDFALYYADSFLELGGELEDTLELTPKGVVLVTPPWNFPLAIPCGGILAALMAGNAVILKPAMETPLVADLLVRACWKAGVPKRALQLLLCDDEVGSELIRDERVRHVVLTGASATARLFRRLRPGIDLAAETGGKNAIIVSATADRDQAIQDVVASAFGHAGQKCSACSLLICEAEVYDDPAFVNTLRDAAASLAVGSAWDPRAFVTPLIAPAREPLLRALTSLERGESWLLEPKQDSTNPRLWSPGIKRDVQAGSFTHGTELFGPLLGMMRADDLDHAIALASATPYGLTAGLHSLDEGEQRSWARRMPAGNLYINRGITGAVVRRQPFGGYGESSFGPGAKAGGPNYVLQMTHAREKALPDAVCPPLPDAAALATHVRRALPERERTRASRAACDQARVLREHFGLDHDPSGLIGERNLHLYRPCDPMLLRAGGAATPSDILIASSAGLTVGLRVELSLSEEQARALPFPPSLPGIAIVVESAEACARRAGSYLRIRALGRPEPEVERAVHEAGGHYADEPVLATARLELLHYLREQSLSHRYHRHGNLAAERLLPPLRG